MSGLNVFLFLLALINKIAISHSCHKTPGNNSDYVEGKSTSVWIPDGFGIPHCQSLRIPFGIRWTKCPKLQKGLRYRLHTRYNPVHPQEIFYDDYSTLILSNYDPTKKTYVLIHGWKSDGTFNTVFNSILTEAILLNYDVNVLIVDWGSVAAYAYPFATYCALSVGRDVGALLNWILENAGGSYDEVHIIGFSLGSHVAGSAGRTTYYKVGRITGLDPAGPLWSYYRALNSNDAQYVEVIHTDGGILGLYKPRGHADFYPNRGKYLQPGCFGDICSHSRAYHLMAATIMYDHLPAKRCKNFKEAKRGQCKGGSLVNMGNAIVEKRESGIYGLSTTSEWPFNICS